MHTVGNGVPNAFYLKGLLHFDKESESAPILLVTEGIYRKREHIGGGSMEPPWDAPEHRPFVSHSNFLDFDEWRSLWGSGLLWTAGYSHMSCWLDIQDSKGRKARYTVVYVASYAVRFLSCIRGNIDDINYISIHVNLSPIYLTNNSCKSQSRINIKNTDMSEWVLKLTTLLQNKEWENTWILKSCQINTRVIFLPFPVCSNQSWCIFRILGSGSETSL